MMVRVVRRYGLWLACFLTLGLTLPAAASERGFPFDRELMLDVAPMPGSKRVPTSRSTPTARPRSICGVRACAVRPMSATTSSASLPGPMQPAQCSADRQTSDENFLAALTQVTNWKRTGNVHRTARCDNVAISLDDQLKLRALSLRRAGHQVRHADGVVDFVVSVARQCLERGAQFGELLRIALPARRPASSAGRWFFPARCGNAPC